MGDVIQVKADEDGCIYIYDNNTKTWQKFCSHIPVRDVPKSVWEKLSGVQRSAIEKQKEK